MKKKVYIVSSKLPPEYSGSGNRIFNTYARLEKYNIHSKFICSSTENFKGKIYKFKNKKILLISEKKILSNKFLFKLKYFFNIFIFLKEFFLTLKILVAEKNKIKLLHIVGNNAVTVAAINFSRIYKIPSIIEVVNDMVITEYYLPSILKCYYTNKIPEWSKIIVISKKLKKLYNTKYPKNNIWYKPNPINKQFLNFKKRNLNNKKDKISILHLAKFIPRKKQNFLIDVLSKLPSNYTLKLYGPISRKGILKKRDIIYLKDIKNQVLRLGLKDRVKIKAKFIPNPAKEISNCDIFALPSINEGLGTTVLEAVALQIPIICNNQKEVFGEFVINGRNGYLTDLNEFLWAKNILKLKKINKNDLIKFSKNIKKKYSYKILDKELIKKINDIN
tara:strand:- start:10947 stop:12116 length:1170 start_codon:yes stop_codon:yes gene_type:complete